MLFLVQLVLVGSGFTCVTGEESADPAMLDMGHMGMGNMPPIADMSGPRADRAGADRAPPADTPTPSSDSCTLPWAPGGCTLMIPCAPHAMTAHGQTIGDGPGPSHAVVVREIGAPPSVTIALDTPPPRV
jgi:hypothetical protein